MATNTEVNVRINVDAKGANNSVGSIKKQLKDATAELIDMRQKFGDSSTEAANAAKKVAELKDAIGDAKNMADAFDPDAKFKAFGATLQGVAGGFSAIQGAQALFGSESEAVSKTLAKVQGAMALSQGINSVLQAKDAFKNLGAVLSNNVVIQKALNFVMTGSFKTQKELLIAKESDAAVTTAQTAATTGLTVAQNIARVAAIALRGAIMATGIGAIVIGIIALIQKIMEWTGVSDEAEKKQQEIAVESNKRNKDYFDQNYKRLQQAQDLAIKEAELAGKSQKEILALRLKGKQDEINAIESRNNELRKMYKSANIDLQNAAVDELEQNKKNQEDLNFEINKIKQEGRQQDIDNVRAYNDQLEGLQQSNYLKSIKNDDKRAIEKSKIDYDNNIKKLNDAQYTEAQRTELEKQYAIQRDQEISAINESANKRAKDKRDAVSKEIQNANDALNKQLLSLQNDYTLMQIKDEDERAKKRLDIQLQASIKEVENSKASEALKFDTISQLYFKYTADIKAIEDAAETKRKEDAAKKRQSAIDFENETFKILEENRIERIKNENDKAFEQESARYQNEIDLAIEALNKKEISDAEYKSRREAIETIHQAKLTDISKAADEERIKNDEEAHQKRISQYKEVGDAAGALSDVIGKQTAVGKGLGVAQATINTYIGASEVLRAKSVLPEPAGTIVKIANVAAIIATGIKSVKAILATKVPNQGGGGGGTIPSVGGGVTAPLSAQMTTTMLNQGQINQLSSATNRAFVLESDVTGNQERIQRLNRAARIS